jgi:hypothetical protein
MTRTPIPKLRAHWSLRLTISVPYAQDDMKEKA